VLTKQHGKSRVVAKGARRPKSRFCGGLEPVTHTLIVYYRKEDRELHTLSQSDIITPFQCLHSDLERLSYASALCELADRLSPAEVENRALFALMLETLGAMESAQPEDLIVLLWFFELRMVTFLGFKPELKTCIGCRRKATGNTLGLSLAKGGVLCPACAVKDADACALSQEVLIYLQHLQTVRTENVTREPPPRGATSEIDNLIQAFLKYHTDDLRDIKSLHVWDRVHSRLPTGES